MVVANDKLTLFNGFALDRARGCLTHSGEPVHLRPQTYRVLQYLADNDGRLISKDALINAVWEGRAVTDGAVGKCIEELRSVFGEEGRQYLRNVRGRGYIFDREPQSEFHTLRETHSEEIDMVRVIVEENGKSKTAVQHDNKTRSRWTTSTSLVAVACVLSCVLVGVYWFSTFRQPATSITSIAVLPLKNETGNAELDYISDGMTETLIGRLSRLPGITVKSRNAVFQYKGKDKDAHAIASDLSVRALLTGRFLQSGNGVTLYVSLIDGRTGNQIWGEQYNRKLDQLASLERETATDIAAQLHAKLQPADKALFARSSTENSDAYLAYLKGRHYWNDPRRFDEGKSLEFFQKAIDLDPTFSLGYAGLGHYYGYAAATGRLPPDENWKRSESAIKKALELDDAVGETHNALAGVQLYYYRDWKGAESSLRKGVELNPASAEVRRHYAKCLVLFGRNDEAVTQIERTLELDPLSAPYYLDAGRIFFWLGRYPQALTHLNNALDLDPNSPAVHDLLGFVYEKMGNESAAIAEWSKLLSLISNEDSVSQLKRTFERSGFAAVVRLRGELKLRELDDRVKHGEYVGAGEYVTAYTWLGDKDKAFAWLDKATQERTRFAFEFKINPLYDPLRSDPRFQQMADRVTVAQ